MGDNRVLVDANVWFSRTLRDWVCLMALDQHCTVYEVLWTEDILAETVTNLRKHYLQWEGGKISNIVDKIREGFPQGRIRDFRVPDAFFDPKDAHVHGAAVDGCADYVVTNNVKDFINGPLNIDEIPY